MKTLFESKEQYLNFRNSWKHYINSGKAKKKRNTIKQYGKDVTLVTPSPLTSEFHLFYSLARGKENNGFVDPSEGLTEAIERISYISLTELKKIFGNAVNKEFVDNIKKMLHA